VVLTVASTGIEDIADYAQRAGDAWKIGRKDVGDGVLVVVARDDRKLRIQVAKAAGSWTGSVIPRASERASSVPGRNDPSRWQCSSALGSARSSATNAGLSGAVGDTDAFM
jgi:hypothetical protein